jgi:hypothetical protein
VFEVFIPTPPQALLVLFYKLANPIEFLVAKSPAPLQSDGIEPEFRGVILTLDVNMGWFIAITGIEEEPVRSSPQHGWHGKLLIPSMFYQ